MILITLCLTETQ